MKATKACHAALEAFVQEHIRTLNNIEPVLENMRSGKGMRRFWPLPTKNVSNILSDEGHQHLDDAARLILSDLKLSRKVTFSAARLTLAQEYDAEVGRAKSQKKFSIDAILSRTSEQLLSDVARNGIYVIPIILASSSPDAYFSVGPVRIFGRTAFHAEYEGKMRGGEKRELREKGYAEWLEYSSDYDHFACVKVDGYEAEKAWEVAQESVEFLLNFLRMFFGFSHASRIRTGFRFLPQKKEARVSFTESGTPLYLWKRSNITTHLPADWPRIISRETSLALSLLASYLSWMLSGDGEGTPVLERTVYANRLLAEAYSEPHAPMRLVRTVSALEALAVVPSAEKSRSVARRCALAGGWANPARAVEINDLVEEAYRVRNMVVHGDLPIDDRRANSAFLKLDDILLEVVVGFYGWYRMASFKKPTSVRKLRREIDSLETWLFWNPHLLFE